MRERPIIFSGPMVRAILAGQKSQTRRIMNPPPLSIVDLGELIWRRTNILPDLGRFSPYGKAGDRLWVRETFTLECCRETGWYEPPHHDGRPIKTVADPNDGTYWYQPHYRATDPVPDLDVGGSEPGCRWRPSIHMPRWASRLTLEVTGVRVQRVQEISEEDAMAEGILEPAPVHGKWCDPAKGRQGHWSYRKPFADLWESINGKRAPWESNPWVWVIEFKRLEASA